MSSNSTYKALYRDGQSQRQRFAVELDPEYAKIDDRSLGDLLRFAKKYAEILKFYDLSGSQNENWQQLFEPPNLEHNIFEASDEEIISKLENNQAHPPHLALYISFLRLFQHAQAHINTLTGRHLNFFYKKVLQLKKKGPVPDKAHLIFELKKNAEPQPIAKGTLLDAGKDTEGNDLSYALTEEIIVNQARIASLRSVFIHPCEQDSVYFAPIANSADGFGGKLDKIDPKWPPFLNRVWPQYELNQPGFSLQKKKLSIQISQDQEPPLQRTPWRNLPQAEIGFALASPILKMQEGDREVTVICTLAGIEDFENIPFSVYFTGAKGWLGPKNTPLEPDEKAECNTCKITDGRLELKVRLTHDDGAVVDYDHKIHTKNFDSFETSLPVMLILLNNQNIDKESNQAVNEEKKDQDTPNKRVAYNKLKNAIIEDIRIDICVNAIKNLSLLNDLGPIDASKPFMPFGPAPIAGSNFYVGCIEAMQKNPYEIILKYEFQNFPERGLVNYYEEYKNDKDNKIIEEMEYFNITIVTPGGCLLTNKNLFGQAPSNEAEDTGALKQIEINQKDDCLIGKPVPKKNGEIDELKEIRSRWALNRRLHIGLTRHTGNLSPPAPPLPSTETILPQDENENIPETKKDHIKIKLQNSFLHKEYRELYTGKVLEFSKSNSNDKLALPNEPYTPIIQNLELSYKAKTINIDLTSEKEENYLNDEIKFFHVTAFGQMRKHPFQTSQLKFVPDGMPYFRVTPKLVQKLQKENIPNFILQSLAELKDKPFENLSKPKTEFLDKLIDKIGERYVVRYKKDILNCSRDNYVYLIPNYKYEGEFYIGISDLQPGQNLSLLFQVTDGSGNPEKKKPDIVWSILSDNYWKALNEGEILYDTTEGLQTSGIVRINISLEATNTNTVMPGKLHWLRAAVKKNSDAVCQLIDVNTNATLVEFKDQNNASDHLVNPLKANSISKLVEPIDTIKNVKQPYSSFGGRPKEDDRGFYSRVSERLRHKNRAITRWDYERLVLEAFPTIYKVKCISPSDISPADKKLKMSPGEVMITAVGNLRNKYEANRFQPKVNLKTLEEIERYLKKHTSTFVKLRVKNPLFEEITLDFNAKFHRGYEPEYYSKLLETHIQMYLSPWAFRDDQDIAFSRRIQKTSIIKYIEDRDYVDFITEVKMYHIVNSEPGLHIEDIRKNFEDKEIVSASLPYAILVTSIKHEINLIK